MHRSYQRKLVVASAVAVVAAFAGGAYAATQSAGPGTRQAFLNDVAKRLHVTPQQLGAALNGAAVDQLQAEVKAGRLTQAQADALEQRLKSGGGGPLGAPLLPRRFRPFGLTKPVGPIAAAGGALPAAASYLGLTGAQLFRQLAGGKSLAQLATAKGKSVSGLERAMATATKSRLDKAVAAKTITQAREQQILRQFSSRLSHAVNTKGFPRLFGLFARPAVPYRGRALPVPPAGGRLAVPPAGGRVVVPPATGVPGMPPAAGVPGVPPAAGVPGVPRANVPSPATPPSGNVPRPFF